MNGEFGRNDVLSIQRKIRLSLEPTSFYLEIWHLFLEICTLRAGRWLIFRRYFDCASGTQLRMRVHGLLLCHPDRKS
jgi:hypothetical protein